jgi:hypothetical protein
MNRGERGVCEPPRGSAIGAQRQCSLGPRPCCNPVPVTNDYFDERMLNRQRLLWAIALRRQLERWEPLVASYLRAVMADREPDGADVWSGEIEHNLALIERSGPGVSRVRDATSKGLRFE